MYKTNSAIVHRDLGDIEHIDQSVRDAQRRKLTQANFNLGASPAVFNTTNKNAYYPMRGQAYSQDQRKVAVDNNRRTNFISQSDGGFEAPQKKFDFASVPDKGKADREQVGAMIDNLRKEHFRLGE